MTAPAVVPDAALDAPLSRAHRLTFFVPGTPITQGSMVIRRGRVAHDKARQLKAWRETIGLVARMAGRGVLPRGPIPAGTPIAIGLIFVIARPAGHFSGAKAPKRHDGLRPCWAGLQLHPNRPDLDKLVRSVGDGLEQAGIIAGDGQIAEFLSPFGKWFADPASPYGNAAGVHVRLEW